MSLWARLTFGALAEKARNSLSAMDLTVEANSPLSPLKLKKQKPCSFADVKRQKASLYVTAVTILKMPRWHSRAEFNLKRIE